MIRMMIRRRCWALAGFLLPLLLFGAWILTAGPFRRYEATFALVIREQPPMPLSPELQWRIDEPRTSAGQWTRQEQDVEVVQGPEPDILLVRAVAPDPSAATMLADRTATALETDSLREAEEWTRKTLAALDFVHRELRRKRDETEQRLQNETGRLVERFPGVDPVVRVPDYLLRREGLSTRIAELSHYQDIDRSNLARIRKEIMAAAHLRSASMSIPPEDGETPGIKAARAHLETLRFEREEAARVRNPDDPKMLRLEARIQEAERRLTALRFAAMMDDLAGREAQLDSRIRLRDAEIAIAVQSLDHIRSFLDVAEPLYTDMRSLKEGLADMDRQRAELDRTIEHVEMMGTRGHLRRVRDATVKVSHPFSATIFESAWVLLPALLLALGAAFIGDRLDTSLRTPEDVRRHMNCAVGGMLPVFPASLLRNLAPEKATPVTEVFDRFATLLRPGEGRPKSLLITSAHHGEGKTTFALHFAAALARQGRRVVLVDADLSTPSIHRLLKIEEAPGFTDMLQPGAEGSEPVDTAVEGLRVVPVGSQRNRPYRILRAERIREILERLGSDADHVVIDSSPLLKTADGLKLAGAVDAVIPVVRSNRLSRRDAAWARQFIDGAEATLLWVALNRVSRGKEACFLYEYFGTERRGPATIND